MDSRVRHRLIVGAAVAVATISGWQIANGTYGLAVILSGAGLLMMVHAWFRLPPDALVAGGVLFGYLVGNRGFAQLHPPNLPLLPAEFALGLGLAVGLWRWTRRQNPPVQRDALNALLLLWMAAGLARLPLDFQHYGLTAIRDFATVYYAGFFFLAQGWSDDERSRRWLQGSLTVGLALTAPAFAAFLYWPEWFLSVLTITGIPLIFVKSDVAGAFMAAGVFWFAERYARSWRTGWLLLCGTALAGLALSNSRAAMVAFGAGVVGLALLRAGRTLAVISAVLAVGLAGLGMHAAVTERPLTDTPIYRMFETAVSVVDIGGTGRYESTRLGDKPDNNQFRMVWWRTVIEETWDEGRWLGLGFGRDLAAEFLRIYYGDANEDFSARSPHNFLLSVFARSGMVGAVILLGILVAMARRTWQAGRQRLRGLDNTLPLWIASWVILISACFGVILEGPMGAVVFWTLLGLASGGRSTTKNPESALEPDAPALPEPAREPEIAPLP